MSGLVSMNPPARSAHNELLGKKKESSVLVRGFSALELAKQAGLIPAHWTEVQFIAWLRQPAVEAGNEANELIATLEARQTVILIEAQAAFNAQKAQIAADAAAQRTSIWQQGNTVLRNLEQSAQGFIDATAYHLGQLSELIAAAEGGELEMAELALLSDILALRNFGSFETVGTGEEQTIPLPINGLQAKNIHIHWEGTLQSHTEHSVVDNVLHFTAPDGMDVVITIT